MADLGELKIPIAMRSAADAIIAWTDELAAAFGLSKSTLSNKAKQIRDVLKMDWNAEFMREDLVDDENSMAWLIQYDGLVMDVRGLTIPIQVEAFEKGLIPYIPVIGREGTAAWLSGNLGFVVPKDPAPGA
jgi:uncharacterized protein DUF6398